MPASSPGPGAASAPSMTLAAIVPATDDPPTLERARAALERGRRKPDQVVVHTGPAAGPAAARNRGAAASDADILVFVDADVEVHPDALELIERRFAGDPELAAIFGAYDEAPADPGLASQYRNLLHHH